MFLDEYKQGVVCWAVAQYGIQRAVQN